MGIQTASGSKIFVSTKDGLCMVQRSWNDTGSRSTLSSSGISGAWQLTRPPGIIAIHLIRRPVSVEAVVMIVSRRWGVSWGRGSRGRRAGRGHVPGAHAGRHCARQPAGQRGRHGQSGVVRGQEVIRRLFATLHRPRVQFNRRSNII